MADMLRFAAQFGIISILIVFLVLAFIAAIVSLFRRLDNHWQAREKAQEAAAEKAEPTIDNTTLVLIVAAVATMFQGRYYIRRVRRLLPSDAVSGTWSMQGRATLHGSHVVSKKR